MDLAAATITWIIVAIIVWATWTQMKNPYYYGIGKLSAIAAFAVSISAGIMTGVRRWKVAIGLAIITTISATIIGTGAGRPAVLAWSCFPEFEAQHRFLGGQAICYPFISRFPERYTVLLLWWGATYLATVLVWDYVFKRTGNKIAAWAGSVMLLVPPTILGTASLEMVPFAVLSVIAAMHYEGVSQIMRYLALGGAGYFRPVFAVFAPVVDLFTRDIQTHRPTNFGAIIFGIAAGIEFGAFLTYTFTFHDPTIINQPTLLHQMVSNIASNTHKLFTNTDILSKPAQGFFLAAFVIAMTDMIRKRTLSRELLLGFAIFFAYFVFHPDGPLKWSTYAPAAAALVAIGLATNSKNGKIAIVKATAATIVGILLIPNISSAIHSQAYGNITQNSNQIAKLVKKYKCSPVVADILARVPGPPTRKYDSEILDAAMYYNISAANYRVVWIRNEKYFAFYTEDIPKNQLPSGRCYAVAFPVNNTEVNKILKKGYKIIGYDWGKPVVGGIIWT